MKSIDDPLDAYHNWIIVQGSDIPKPQLTDYGVKADILKDLLELINNTPNLGGSHPHFAGYISSKQLIEAIKTYCGEDV